MYDMMQGVKVVEVAEHTFVPAAAMILADWGAEVIKVERTTGGGDPGRNLGFANTEANGFSMFFEAGNRGKQSIALDLTRPEGRAILHRLIGSADVFITNLRADARRKLGIEPADVQALNPRIVYARGTGYGLQGEMANDGGFDFPSSWCRSGSGWMQTLQGGEPPMQPGSVGDLGGGATLAGAIAAALFRRERTGKGAIVDNALYLFGIYLMSQSVVAAGLGIDRKPQPRDAAPNPLINLYRTSDDRWLSLCLLVEAWWPDLAQHLDAPHLAEDPRFADAKARAAHAPALRAELDAIFSRATLAEWKDRLSTFAGVWAPLQTPGEVVADPQALANGFVTPVTAPDGRRYLAGASPAQFDGAPIGDLRAAPGYGEHTTSVLAGLGLAEDEIAALRAAGFVR